MSSMILEAFNKLSESQREARIELLYKLYREMLKIRLFEERIADHYAEQQMRCPVHLCIGQEAVAVGVSEHLGQSDAVYSGHRAHGHYMAKGGCLQAMLDEIYGKGSGCSKGRGGSMHLIDLSVNFRGSTPIVGGILPVAMGHAFGEKLKNNNSVTVAYLGEACTEEGVFHECLNFSSLHKIPILYVVENNLYSVYTPLDQRQPNRSIIEFGRANQIESYEGDGNNVETVYRLADQAIRNIQKDKGPQLLVFNTYRWREHCGPNYDNDLGYRTEKEFIEWKKRCPIECCEHRLNELKGFSNEWKEDLIDDLEAEFKPIFDRAKSACWPESTLNKESVYA